MGCEIPKTYQRLAKLIYKDIKAILALNSICSYKTIIIIPQAFAAIVSAEFMVILIQCETSHNYCTFTTKCVHVYIGIVMVGVVTKFRVNLTFLIHSVCQFKFSDTQCD